MPKIVLLAAFLSYAAASLRGTNVNVAQSYTLSDGKLSATLGGTATDFGSLTELKAPDGVNVIDGGTGHVGSVWSASFVGAGLGKKTISALTATCSSTAAGTATSTAQSFKWIDCVVQLPPAPSPGPKQWVQHKASNCAGKCMPAHSPGPKGGNCDRLPDCGHDAGLPFCEVGAMKARCGNVSGCTQFNTNGYLYSESTAVSPFSEYPLECWSFEGPPGPAPLVNVTLEVALNDGLLEYSITFDSTGSLSLWAYTVLIAQVKTTSTTRAVSTDSARQLVGFFQTGSMGAVYFAAHDPAQIVKRCTADATGGVLQCTVDALDATLPLHQYKAAFPIVTTVIPGGDWWDIAQVYRAWVLPNSHWTKNGPLDTRTDLPDWLENVTLWVENNWGGDPLSPPLAGGDPEHVKLEMLKFNNKLNLAGHDGHLALHWYEWDTLGFELGSNYTVCDPKSKGGTGAPCGFDTHYPNYFPARTGCKESIKAMQAEGMKVIPYINGQLFDTRIKRWTAENATQWVQKFVDESMLTHNHTPALNPHIEHFDGIEGAVMCPATKYWHDVMRDTLIKIVNDIGFDGCYVDQVGNGEKRNCGDPTHNHTLHGGSFWAEGFYSLLAEVRAAVPAKSSMFMTEGIVEEVSGTGFDILLGLEWSSTSGTSSSTTLPYWHAIYGGYGYATGRAGSVNKPLSNGLCGELTAQFMQGGTMGWFTYQNYGNQFFDPANAGEVAYITKLSKARITAKEWMVHGRVTRTLQGLSKDLKGACFLRDSRSKEAASVVCAIALPTKTNPAGGAYSLSVAPSRYGMVVPSGSKVALTDLATGEALGSFDSDVTYSATVPVFGVQLLKLTVA